MANKKAVLGRPLPDATVSRNAFDRSSLREYHTALGQLTPVWWEPVIAGSHCKINRKIFQRTADVNTAAFPKIDTHLQYYFVPMRLMWSYWENFKLGINDYNSSALGYQSQGTDTYPTSVPYTTLGDFASALSYMSTNNLVDSVGMPVLPFAQKVLNYLGYGQGNSFPATGQTGGNVQVNLWPLLAYHKIYYDYFRNTAYESNRPSNYNVDRFWAASGTNSIAYTSLVAGSQASYATGILSPHYVNYRHDYFTNMYPALNYVQSLPTGQSWQIPSNVAGLSSAAALVLSGTTGSDDGRWNGSLTGSSNVGTYDNGLLYKTASSNSSLYNNSPNGQIKNTHDHSLNVSVNATIPYNVQSIRAAFALDKLMRSSAYAPKHIKQQYEARFGIKFKKNTSECDFVGAYMNDMTIGEVTSTAATQYTSGGDTITTPVGSIGGKGVSFSDWQNTITYDAQEDGILMAVQYTTIRSSYRALGLDSYLTKFLPEDYFQPEFQDLGLEPVLGIEFNRGAGSSIVMGYRPRNQRYKIGIDKNYGLFSDSNSDMYQFINHTDSGRVPSQSGLSFAWFKVQPTDLNGIMAVDFDGDWNTDQFINQTEFGFTCVQNMSVHGQPKL